MKLKVIQGEKGKKHESHNKQQNEQRKSKAEKSVEMQNYASRGGAHAEQMEKAEGDEDIVDEALRNQSKKGDAA